VRRRHLAGGRARDWEGKVLQCWGDETGMEQSESWDPNKTQVCGCDKLSNVICIDNTVNL
jgi:hypothetical protein